MSEVVDELLDLGPIAAQEEWYSLRRLVMRTRGLTFAVYFVDTAAAEYISALIRSDVHGFEQNPLIIDNRLPDLFVSSAFAQIYAWGEANRLSERHAPIFIELYRGRQDDIWDTVRQEFLLSLNQARSRLELEVPCPVVLLLPPSSRRELASLAPDMWHIRLRSKSLTADYQRPKVYGKLRKVSLYAQSGGFLGRPLVFEAVQQRRIESLRWLRRLRWVVRHRQVLKFFPMAFDLIVSRVSEDALDILAYLFDNNHVERAYRLARRWHRGMEQLHATRDAMPWASAGCGALAEACRRIGDLASAEELALTGLARIEGACNIDDEARRRFRSELLYRLGSIRFARGLVQDAEAPLRQSIGLDRELIAANPENLFFWQSLLSGLNRLGDILLSQGEAKEAFAHFREGRDIAVRIYNFSSIASAGTAHILRSLNGMTIASIIIGDTSTAAETREKTKYILSSFRRKVPQSTSYGEFFLTCGKLLQRNRKLRFMTISHPLRKSRYMQIEHVERGALSALAWSVGWTIQIFSKPAAANFFCVTAMKQFWRHLENYPNDWGVIERCANSATVAFWSAFKRGAQKDTWLASTSHMACISLLESRPIRDNSSLIFESVFIFALTSLFLSPSRRYEVLVTNGAHRLLTEVLDDIKQVLRDPLVQNIRGVQYLINPDISAAELRALRTKARIYGPRMIMHGDIAGNSVP